MSIRQQTHARTLVQAYQQIRYVRDEKEVTTTLRGQWQRLCDFMDEVLAWIR